MGISELHEIVSPIWASTCYFVTVKPVLSCHSKINKTKILMINGSLLKVESIAECSPWSILQYFWPALSDNPSWIQTFDLSIEWPLKTGFTVLITFLSNKGLDRLARAFAASIHQEDLDQNLDLWPCLIRQHGCILESHAHMQYYLILYLIETPFNAFANRADIDQAALARSGSTLFAYENMIYLILH